MRKETHPDIIKMMFGEKVGKAIELFKKDVLEIISNHQDFFKDTTMAEEGKVYDFDFETHKVTPNKDLPQDIKDEIINACSLRFQAV